MAEKPDDIIKDEAPTPTELIASQAGKIINNMYKRKIICKIWRKIGSEYVQVAQKGISIDKDKFVYKGFEYIMIVNRIHWEKSGVGRRMSLNFLLGQPAPIDFNPPNVYQDAKIGAELHRRKAFTSLLNKMDTLMLVMVVIMSIALVAAIALYIYGQTQKIATDRLNSALTAENAALKERFGVEVTPGQRPA